MIKTTFNRRSLITGAAGALAAVAWPRWALAMPSVSEVAYDPAMPALANPEGDVTIVEIVDYQCPYCKLAYLEIMRLVTEDPGIRLVMKDLPVFGPTSRFAARALLASTDDRLAYVRAVDALMRHERKLTKRRVEKLLGEAGIDVSTIEDRMASRKQAIELVLGRNIEHAVEFKLRGTPALLIGSALYRRAMPLDDLRGAVARARAEAVPGRPDSQVTPETGGLSGASAASGLSKT